MYFYSAVLLLLVSTTLLVQECSSTPSHSRPAFLTPIHTTTNYQAGKVYSFAYDTRGQPGAQMFRKETRNANGLVTGSYGYVDPNGHLRQVDYTAGPKLGFQARGDTGVDYETLKAANQIAKLAPQPPTAPLSPLPPPSVGLSLLYPQYPQVHYPQYSQVHYPVKTVPYLGLGRPIVYYIQQ